VIQHSGIIVPILFCLVAGCLARYTGARCATTRGSLLDGWRQIAEGHLPGPDEGDGLEAVMRIRCGKGEQRRNSTSDSNRDSNRDSDSNSDSDGNMSSGRNARVRSVPVMYQG